MNIKKLYAVIFPDHSEENSEQVGLVYYIENDVNNIKADIKARQYDITKCILKDLGAIREDADVCCGLINGVPDEQYLQDILQ